MRILSKKQYNDLEKALNHLFNVGCDITVLRNHIENTQQALVDSTTSELQIAMDLIFNIVDPIRD